MRMRKWASRYQAPGREHYSINMIHFNDIQRRKSIEMRIEKNMKRMARISVNAGILSA